MQTVFSLGWVFLGGVGCLPFIIFRGERTRGNRSRGNRPGTLSEPLPEPLSECHFPRRAAGSVAPNCVAPWNSCTFHSLGLSSWTNLQAEIVEVRPRPIKWASLRDLREPRQLKRKRNGCNLQWSSKGLSTVVSKRWFEFGPETKFPLVAPSTGWMLYYLCFTHSTAIGPPLR